MDMDHEPKYLRQYEYYSSIQRARFAATVMGFCGLFVGFLFDQVLRTGFLMTCVLYGFAVILGLILEIPERRAAVHVAISHEARELVRTRTDADNRKEIRRARRGMVLWFPLVIGQLYALAWVLWFILKPALHRVFSNFDLQRAGLAVLALIWILCMAVGRSRVKKQPAFRKGMLGVAPSDSS